MKRLEGKVAFIAGCGTDGSGFGNGKAITTLFAKEGASIYGVDINLAAAQETAQVVQKNGGTIKVSQCNVTISDQVEQAVQLCIKQYGRIDVLVQNVGKSEPGDPVTMSEEVWDAQMQVNLKTVFLCMKHVLPIMERQRSGAVVCISSIAALRYIGKPQVAYAATKAAIIQLTNTTAVIYADRGIRLNTVIPGLMNTPLVHTLAKKYNNGDYDSMVTMRNAQVPTGRMGESWDVAQAALFLASDDAKYITASQIVVDGAITASTGKPKL